MQSRQGKQLETLEYGRSSSRGALFNNHDGAFANVAEKAGSTNGRWGFGVTVSNYDNDGWPDLYVDKFGKNRLYHNNHDGTFTNVAVKAVLRWAAGSHWCDLWRLRWRRPAGPVRSS